MVWPRAQHTGQGLMRPPSLPTLPLAGKVTSGFTLRDQLEALPCPDQATSSACYLLFGSADPGGVLPPTQAMRGKAASPPSASSDSFCVSAGWSVTHLSCDVGSLWYWNACNTTGAEPFFTWSLSTFLELRSPRGWSPHQSSSPEHPHLPALV